MMSRFTLVYFMMIALLFKSDLMASARVEAILSTPSEVPSAPTHDAEDVISIFSDAYTDVTVDTYRTSWSVATLLDTTIADNAVKRYSGLDFVGIETVANQLDITDMTHVHIDVWSDDFTQFSLKLVDFGPDGAFSNAEGKDDTEHQVDFMEPNKGEWISYDIPLSDFVNLTTKTKLSQYILVGRPAGASTVFIDNFYFYKGEVVTPEEPVASAPTTAPLAPTHDAKDVISIFSDAYTDVTVDTYRTSWSVATLLDTTIADNAVKRYSGLDFVGIETVANQLDITDMTHVHIDVWSGDFTQFSLKLVDFGPDGAFSNDEGKDDTEHQVDFMEPNKGEWISYDIPLSDFVNLSTKTKLSQYILVGRPAGASTVFIDNFYFYKGEVVTPEEPVASAPTTAPSAPTHDAEDVISIFSDAYMDVTVDTYRTDWSAGTLLDTMIADNAVKRYSGLDFVGIETVANQLDITEMTHVHIDVWSSDFTQFSLKLVDFGPDGAFSNAEDKDDTEHQVDFMEPNKGEWISYDIPLSDFVNLTTKTKLSQYILVGRPAGASTVFIDNFYFYKGEVSITPVEPVAMAPSMAAPAPSHAAENVISLFSDAYTDVTVDTYRTDWSAGALLDTMIADNAVKRYSGLDFVGIETVANQLDITDMTHVHIDVWSSDFTQFSMKLVDFGPDGAFSNAEDKDDTEHQVDFMEPNKGEWVSYDIPLSDFTNLTTKTKLSQYILVGRPIGATTIFIDNFYFYTNNPVAKSSDATLSGISIGETPLADFASETLQYDFILEEANPSTPMVSAMATDANATVSITQATGVPGEAIIMVTAEDGITTKSYSISFTALTLSAIDASTLVSTYPNPASNQLFVSLRALKPVSGIQAHAVNSIGQEVHLSYQLGSQGLVLDVSRLDQGLYTLRLVYGDAIYVAKFLK